MSSHSVPYGLESTLLEKTFSLLDEFQEHYDVVIQFLCAEVNHSTFSVNIRCRYVFALKDIPKMDVVGHADPYFIANIDDQITFT